MDAIYNQNAPISLTKLLVHILGGVNMALFETVFLIYVILGTVLAFLMWKNKESDISFFLANRKLSGLLSALTYAATTYSAFMMVGLVGLAYTTGIGALGFELVYLVSTVFILSYYGPKIWRIAKEKNIVSPYELLDNKSASILASVLSLLALIPYISVQLIGSAIILDKYSAFDYYTAVMIITVITIVWAVIAGLRSVAITDALQGIVMLISAFGIVIFSFLFIGNGIQYLGQDATVPNSFWTPYKFFIMTVPWMFFAITNPQVFQRVFVPKDKRSLKNMIILFAIFGFVFTLLTTILGLNLKGLTNIGTFTRVKNKDEVTATLLALVPEWLGVLVALSIVMAAVTTMNSILLTLSSVISRNIGLNVNTSRTLLVLLAVTVFIFSLFKPGYIVELAVLSSTALLPTLVPFLGKIHGKKGSVLLSLLGGTITFMVGKIILIPLLPLWILIVSLLCYFINAGRL